MLISLPEITAILQGCKTIAVVGLSPKESRPSNDVARYLLTAGFTVIPVNPGQDAILGEKCYPSLTAIPVPVDLVNIFRRSDEVGPVVDDAIAIKAKGIWMQQGIVNEKAAAKAKAAGLQVIMDRCIKVDHANLFR